MGYPLLLLLLLCCILLQLSGDALFGEFNLTVNTFVEKKAQLGAAPEKGSVKTLSAIVALFCFTIFRSKYTLMLIKCWKMKHVR